MKSAQKIDICEKWEKKQEKSGKIVKKAAFLQKKGKNSIQIEVKRYRERRTDGVVDGRTKKKKKYFRQMTNR